jgi:alpha-beta hydrolase superfamily lysophospholipase
MTTETELLLPIGTGIPAIMARPADRPALGTVLIFHGLSATKEHQWPEIRRLAAAGFIGVVIDAPCHGGRYDPYLERVLQEGRDGNRLSFKEILHQAIREIPLLITYFTETEHLPVGISGISLGGHTAFCSLLCSPAPDVCVPLIGAPVFTVAAAGHQTPDEAFERLPTIPLLVVTAAQDTIVPPGPALELVDKLRPRYAAFPERLRSLHFTESGHHMRGEDWHHAWDEIIAWFIRYLPGASRQNHP